MTRSFVVLIVLLTLLVSPLAADSSFKCLLVSIEGYAVAPLKYAENDVAGLAQTLMQRHGAIIESCIDSDAMDGESGPDVAKHSIMRRIEAWCKSIGSEDKALLYLSGHGVKDESGKLYFAMKDFGRDNFDTAAVPFEWICDQLGKSLADNKMLLIDMCFSEILENISIEQTTSMEIIEAFANLHNIVTITSSRGDEPSYYCKHAEHSLFTYWLIEAFKGHADLDGDMVVTCDEIVRYVQENVPRDANSFNRQHPVVYNEAAGANFKLPLRAVSGTFVISRIAQPASPDESLPVPAAAPSTNPAGGQFDVWIATRRVGSSGGYTGNLFEFRGNDCYFPISKGEEYQINIRAGRSPGANPDDVVFVRIVVDGLNTPLPQQKTVKVGNGIYLEAIETGSEGK